MSKKDQHHRHAPECLSDVCSSAWWHGYSDASIRRHIQPLSRYFLFCIASDPTWIMLTRYLYAHISATFFFGVLPGPFADQKRFQSESEARMKYVWKKRLLKVILDKTKFGEWNKDNKLDSTTNSKGVAGMLYEDIGGDDSQGWHYTSFSQHCRVHAYSMHVPPRTYILYNHSTTQFRMMNPSKNFS